jgi:transposase
MPRTHPPYAPEYRRRIIELARSGRPIAQLAREFEASANAIRKWVKQAGLDEGLRSDGLTTAEREELNRLRRENRMLRFEQPVQIGRMHNPLLTIGLTQPHRLFHHRTSTTPHLIIRTPQPFGDPPRVKKLTNS